MIISLPTSPISLSGIALALSLLCLGCAPAQRFGSTAVARERMDDQQVRERLWQAARTWLQVPYRYGGMDRNGIDCSGLTVQIYRQAFAVELPRTARQQMQGGRFVRQPWLQAGDLLFFGDLRQTFQDHVGIYLGNNRFIHATVNEGVVVSDLTSAYYRERLLTVRRYLP